MNEAVDNKYEKLKDQFTTPTRTVRRNLLVSASILVTMLVLGAQIDSIFGLKFKHNIPVSIPIGALSIVVIYELITFIVYSFTDYKSWRLKPYEKTYQFTEEKLDRITTDLNVATENLKIQTLEAFKSVPSTNQIKLEIETIEFGPLIDPVIFQQDFDHNDGIAPRTQINPIHREIEEKYRRKIEVKAKEFINNIIAEKTDVWNTLVENEKNSYFAKLNSHLDEANKTIDLNLANIKKSTKGMHEFITDYEKNISKYHQQIKSFNFSQWLKIYLIDFGTPVLLGIFALYLTHESTISFIRKLLNILIKP